MRALEARDEWWRLTGAVDWIATHDVPGRYVHQIDAPGVDTKFVESNRRLFADLLDAVLPPERVDTAVSVTQFARRYGFATKPGRVRWRVLDQDLLTAGFSELLERRGEAPRRRVGAVDAAESAVYRSLLDDELGECVRLEQERARFHRVHDALAHLAWRPS